MTGCSLTTRPPGKGPGRAGPGCEGAGVCAGAGVEAGVWPGAAGVAAVGSEDEAGAGAAAVVAAGAGAGVGAVGAAAGAAVAAGAGVAAAVAAGTLAGTAGDAILRRKKEPRTEGREPAVLGT